MVKQMIGGRMPSNRDLLFNMSEEDIKEVERNIKDESGQFIGA